MKMVHICCQTLINIFIMKNYKIFFYLKSFFKLINYYLSKLGFKREIFTVEVPTTCMCEQDKQQLMSDVLEILEQEIKLH